MLKKLGVVCLVILSLTFYLLSEEIKRLPLPDDFDINIDTSKKNSASVNQPTVQSPIQFKTEPIPSSTNREPILPQAIESQQQEQIKNEVASLQREGIISPNIIDENYVTLNKLSDVIFSSLRKQYNYIIKLENDINKLKAGWTQDRKNLTDEKKLLETNLNKLKEQNDSYLKIFDKLRNDNQQLQEKISSLQQSIQNRDARILQLENILKSLQERLTKIKMLSTLGND